MDLTTRASKIKLLLMDVDGVLTNGKLYNVPDPAGQLAETNAFDSHDRIALQCLNCTGLKPGVIRARHSPATAERARQCKVADVYQGHIEKIPILEEILADARLAPEEVA